MSLKHVTDEAGDSLMLLEVDGFLFAPDLSADVVKGLGQFPFRDDDVMVCSYPKSGCHWVWEILRMLQEGTLDVAVQEKEDLMMEWKTPEFMDKFPSPRVLNTHVLLRHLNPELFEKKIKIIMVVRNPKDVAVSFYHHHKKLVEYEYNGQFTNYVPNYLDGKVDSGCVFDYTRDWEKEIDEHPEHPILLLCYEDMKENLFREVKKIANFLGKSFEDVFYQKIADKCTFSKMRDRKGAVHTEWGDNIFYRKGEVGDWKNWFTVAQSEWCDRICEEKMSGSKIIFRYTLDDNTETNNNDGGS
ncbi:sulfotransferase 1A1-like isoform X1 [Haliotis rubra]|uniref:sulfotransferase 1A1-like isoform X1 n=1 Tax=Haliotis rubra TaxID=36100 RepID=UPI001EE5688C|nr:sulfotransferase 1A1-like isoform X1 [Haliotis rubra]